MSRSREPRSREPRSREPRSREPRRLPLLIGPLTLAAVLTLVACGGGAAGPPSDAAIADVGDGALPSASCYDQPLTGKGSRYDGDCYRTPNCKRDEACVDARCGPCTTPEQCRSTQGCLLPAGTCGACRGDEDCEADKRCFAGHCIREAMRVFELTVDSKEWNKLRIDERYDQYTIPCALTVAGVEYPACTVRPRGQSSLDYKKLPLRITFPEDADHPGYARKINLRSEYNDRSYLRLVLANETFRRLTEIPTPRTRFVRLAVNDHDYGIYVEYERIGGKFLTRHRRDREASMYEADPASGEVYRRGITQLLPLPDAALYPQGYQKKTGASDTDFGDLIALIEGAIGQDFDDGASCRVRERVNLELYLDYLAVMGIIQGRDHVRKNFYLSRQADASGKPRWEFYPWDLDLSFGCTYTDEDLTLCEAVRTDGDPLFGTLPAGRGASYPADAVYNLLMETVLRDPGLRAEVEGRICEMIASDFWRKEIFSVIDAYEEALAPQLADDSWDRIESIDQFTTAVEEVRRFIRQRTAFLESLLGCGQR